MLGSPSPSQPCSPSPSASYCARGRHLRADSGGVLPGAGFGRGRRPQRDRHDAEVAAVQLSDSVERASGYVDSLRQFFGRRATVTEDGFSEFADAALMPVGLLHAAWVEPVRASGRADYERASANGSLSRASTGGCAGARAPAYFPATLTAVRRPPAPVAPTGETHRRCAGCLTARAGCSASRRPVPSAARVASAAVLRRVAPRPAAMGGQRQGFVVVRVPARWLLGSPLVPAVGRRVAVTVDGVPIAATVRGDIVRRSFTGAGLRWTVVVPVRAASGAGAPPPWLILVAGAIVAVLAGGLGLSAARRAKAQDSRPDLPPFPRRDRGRKLRRQLHARQPRRGTDSRLHAG